MIKTVKFERSLSGPNEVFGSDGQPYPVYDAVLGELERIGPEEWERRNDRAREHMLDEQRSFGLEEEDKTHPIDRIPRIVPAADWRAIEEGVAQRVRAINEFLRRVEAGTEEIVPDEVIKSSTLYDPAVPTRFGEVPARQMGLDLVALEDSSAGNTGGWRYLFIEDNVKMPVGLVPMSFLRKMSREVLPESCAELAIRPLDGLLPRFGDALRGASVAAEPQLAILSTGPQDQYYLDHHILARDMGGIVAERHELVMDGEGYLVYKPTGGRIDVIYERIEDGRIYDTLPDLAQAHAAGRVQAVFSPNVDLADDKGVYPFVPEMIRRYLGEEPAIENVGTYSLAVEEDRRYVMENFDKLVIKSRGGWGGKGVLISPEETKEAIEEFRRAVEENPVEFVAQEPLDFSTHVLCETTNGGFTLRDSYADYRVHAISYDQDTVEVVPGAMTRVAAPGSRLVNVSSGGKIKDTWVLEE